MRGVIVTNVVLITCTRNKYEGIHKAEYLYSKSENFKKYLASARLLTENNNIRDRVNNSFNNLIEFTDNASSSNSASRYIVDYYWNAIKSKTEIYDEIKRHEGIQSFEDVVEPFTEFCYGEL